MAKTALITETRGEGVYLSDAPDRFIHEFREAPADYDGEEVASFPGKPDYNLKIAAELFRFLEKNRIKTHYLRDADMRSMETRNMRRFPVLVICRNVAAGSFAARTGLSEGEILPLTIVEFKLKTDALKHMAPGMGKYVFTEISDGEVKAMHVKAMLANRVLQPFMYNRGIVLADYCLEFGRDSSGCIRIGGALSPDTCRMYDRDTLEKVDRDRFRRPLRGSEEACAEVLRRITASN